MGPILFLIVINGISKWKYSKHGLFADNKYDYLHFKLPQLNDAANKIVTDGKAVVDWAKEVGLEVNFQKTKVIILGSSRKLKHLESCNRPQIIINGNIIPYVNSTKHLGIHLTNNLSWDVHVAHIARKVYATLIYLKHRKNILSTSTRKLLITVTIIPIIEYCSLVQIDSSKRLDYKLQRLLNESIRFIYNSRRDEHITPYRQTLNWLTIKSKRRYCLACFFYKLLNTGLKSFWEISLWMNLQILEDLKE